MKTLQECKDEVAKNQGFKDWADYCVYMKSVKVSLKTFELATDLVSDLYARAKWNESYDEAQRVFGHGTKPEFKP